MAGHINGINDEKSENEPILSENPEKDAKIHPKHPSIPPIDDNIGVTITICIIIFMLTSSLIYFIIMFSLSKRKMKLKKPMNSMGV